MQRQACWLSEAPRVFPWMLDGLDEARTEHILGLIPEPVRTAYADEWLTSYLRLDRWGGSRGRS